MTAFKDSTGRIRTLPWRSPFDRVPQGRLENDEKAQGPGCARRQGPRSRKTPHHFLFPTRTSDDPPEGLKRDPQSDRWRERSSFFAIDSCRRTSNWVCVRIVWRNGEVGSALVSAYCALRCSST